jgi:hypothetical protein
MVGFAGGGASAGGGGGGGGGVFLWQPAARTNISAAANVSDALLVLIILCKSLLNVS